MASHKPIDVFFMTLVVLKHRGTLNFLAQMFRIKGTTFQDMNSVFIRMFAPYMYEIFGAAVASNTSLGKLRDKECLFKTFQFAVAANDVTFQKSNRPSGNILERKRCFSGIHEVSGFKLKDAVRAKGFCNNSALLRPMGTS